MIFGTNKKGNVVIEGITVIVVAMAFAMMSVFSYYVFDELNTEVQDDVGMDATAKEKSQNLYNNFPSLFDNLFLFVFVLLVIFVLVSVFMLDSHPIMFMISVILLIAVFVVALLLANVYNDVMVDATMASYANAFSYTGWLMSHLLETMIGVVFMIIIALFIKFKQ